MRIRKRWVDASPPVISVSTSDLVCHRSTQISREGEKQIIEESTIERGLHLNEDPCKDGENQTHRSNDSVHEASEREDVEHEKRTGKQMSDISRKQLVKTESELCQNVDGSHEEKEKKVKMKLARMKNRHEEEDVRKKKATRNDGAVEGSRCSRVNGRGWRCCQQTLVGYSLCEHHLGKGRVRSIATVRGLPVTREKINVGKHQNPPVESEEDSDQEHKEKPNKKKRIGIVKARSLSSLLGFE